MSFSNGIIISFSILWSHLKKLDITEYQTLYTDFAYPLPHHRINENNQCHRKAALYTFNTIAIIVMETDRVED